MSSSAELLPQLRTLLPLDDGELKQVLEYSSTLPPDEARMHLHELLGDSPEAIKFISDFNQPKSTASMTDTFRKINLGDGDIKSRNDLAGSGSDGKRADDLTGSGSDGKRADGTSSHTSQPIPSKASAQPPRYMQPTILSKPLRTHNNIVTRAAELRARDEQEMQQTLQTLQNRYGIFNSDIEPEHETEYYCACDIHHYRTLKWHRYRVQNQWSEAVKYPGEKTYTDAVSLNGVDQSPRGTFGGVSYPDKHFSLSPRNPYVLRVTSPYGTRWTSSMQWGPSVPVPAYYTQHIQQVISLNSVLNKEGQIYVDSLEPKQNIWDENRGKLVADFAAADQQTAEQIKKSKLKSFRKSLGMKSSEEKANKIAKSSLHAAWSLRDKIVEEEHGRWPDEAWRSIVLAYQDHVAMATKIRDLREKSPLQYLHLLRAGYFEPIPVAWANSASNPLKFSIEAIAGWRGITPAWRGYEDTAEERLYWVLNHREGSAGMRMKPDMISEMRMAQDRMARAVEPPPAYATPTDTCHIQHTSDGYSKQVMPPPFRPVDRPETPDDDTMILLDISGSMDFDPQRPLYREYLITNYTHSTQPKNKDVAKAVIRRFTDAMAHHDHHSGYDLVTFSSRAHLMGSVTHQNLDQFWNQIRFGGTTRVMTGWQLCKERHFEKHSQSATYHPVYGWQAGPETPILRLLLLLDGEASDMDEFELDLLGSSWAHVTIFLIGVDGCPHHHRHANELERISNVNHHISFVDAQGNFPERFVTHELLKRHLGYDISMQEFEQMEELPPYTQF